VAKPLRPLKTQKH